MKSQQTSRAVTWGALPAALLLAPLLLGAAIFAIQDDAGPASHSAQDTEELDRLRADVQRLEAELVRVRAEPTPQSPGPDVEAATGETEAEQPGAESQPGSREEAADSSGDRAPTSAVAGDVRSSLESLAARLSAAAGEDPTLWLALAQLHMLADDPEAAAQAMLTAHGLGPDDDQWWSLFENLSAETRLPLMEALVPEDPENDELWGNLADARLELGRGPEAFEAYLRALELDPIDDEWSGQLASADPARAVQFLEQAAAERPDHDELWGNLADAYRESGRPHEALTSYERALEVDPSDSEWLERIMELDPARGMSILQTRLAEAPTSDEAWGDLGDAHSGQGNLAEALAAYLKAVELDPEDEEWLPKIAEIDPAGVIGLLEERAADQPTDDERWGDLGDAYLATQRPADALRCYQRAADLDPTDEEWPAKIGELQGS